jgi:hypothetical protein
MKKFLLLAFFCLPLIAFSQEHQVGLRLGEPLSITYKTFIDDRISVEGMVGRAGANSPMYYRNAFDRSRPAPNALYNAHSTYNGFSLNARAAYHEDITGEFDITEGKLWAYGGVGAQLRSVQVDYLYSVPTTNGAPIISSENRTNIDFGPEAFIGSEYYFQDLPIVVFAEVGLFMELVDRPGHLKLQGGIGARYIF